MYNIVYINITYLISTIAQTNNNVIKYKFVQAKFEKLLIFYIIIRIGTVTAIIGENVKV